MSEAAVEIFFNIQVDCESTDPAFDNPALGERALRGLGELFAAQGMKATFVVVPTDMQIHSAIFGELEAQGHEIGLHIHPAAQGYSDFLGVYGYADQLKIIGQGAQVFADKMGYLPKAFTPGYASANDHTFPALEALGFTHGWVSLPTRNLPQCASVWGSSPLDVHYPHRYNRCLRGDVNFVDVPLTVDTESRMWGGAHPQDLRIELVDAKNHWYTIYKNVRRQLEAGDQIPIKHLKAFTHNTYDYLDPREFRRQTLLGVIEAARNICKQERVRLIPATTGEIAGRYRQVMQPSAAGGELKLDTRGRSFARPSGS